jgi:hypothetical protein
LRNIGTVREAASTRLSRLPIEHHAYGFNSNASMKFEVNDLRFRSES